MGKIVILATLGALSLSACGGLVQDCYHQQQRVAQAAAVANRDLKPGMYPQEVQALLGPSEMTIQYWQSGSPETWKYVVLEDCKIHQGISAPTTELYFVRGQLQKWFIYGR